MKQVLTLLIILFSFVGFSQDFDTIRGEYKINFDVTGNAYLNGYLKASHGILDTTNEKGVPSKYDLTKYRKLNNHDNLNDLAEKSFNSLTDKPVFPVASSIAFVSGSNATTTGQSLVNITGLSVALLANSTYEFEVILGVSTTAVTTGTKYGVNYSAAGASVFAVLQGSSTASAMKSERLIALNTASGTYLTTSAQSGGIEIKGIITTGANAGNFTVSHLKVTSGTSTVFVNSYLKVTKL